MGRFHHLLRVRDGHEAPVTVVELFFDLIYVFSVTQLSHHLLEHLTPLGAARTLVLWLAVWQAWQYTSWSINWLDPERLPIRRLLFAIMLVGLVMAASIPEAFGARAAVFAFCYAGIQVGRTIFVLIVLGPRHPLTPNFRRILAWFCTSGLLWIAGAFVDERLRLWLWTLAMAAEYGSLAVGFWFPGLGRSQTADWTIEGGHLAERWQLFVIVALGESVLVTGATFAAIAMWDTAIVLAMLAAFFGTVAMWWIYFDRGSRAGSEKIAHARDPGRLGAYFLYIHVTLVAGIILSAVGNELVIAHPHGHVGLRELLVLLGGPGIYLAANAAYKALVYGRLPRSHVAGLLALAALIPLGPLTDLLVMGVVTTVLLIVVAQWEGREQGRARADDAAVRRAATA